ncbi:MAG: BatD family protein [bacterium]
MAGGRVALALGVVLALALLAPPARAAELEFAASVDRSRVGVGQRFALTVTVSGTNLGRVPQPQLPDLSGFNQLGSTSSQSTNISVVNGRMTRQETISFIYFLAARETGELVIGPCRLTHGGSSYSTSPITISAVAADQAPGQPPARPPMPDPFDPFGPPAEPVSTDDIQLVAGADRTSVWQGEQVTVTWTFYTRRQVASLNLAQVPAFAGFWSERLFDADKLDYRQARLGDREYSAVTLKRVALFPTRSGRLEVGAMRVAGAVVRRGGFFFDSTEPFEVGSRQLAVEVRPLPDSGRPASFSGGVGSFTVSAALDRDSSDGGAPVNLTVRVEGTGNIQLVGEPKLPQVASLRVLNPETRDRITRADGRVRGSREFVYPLIPQASGRHALPPVEFGFFDPVAGSYYVRTTPSLEFVATGVTAGAPLAEAEPGVRVISTDIRHIKTGARPAAIAGGLAAGPPWWGWLCYPAGLGALLLGVALGAHRRRLEQDRGYARGRRASRLVRRRLAEAGRLLRAGREREFYAALAGAVAGYAGDRFNLETGGMTGDELRAALAGRGVAEPTVGQLLELVRACDVARFSPGLASCPAPELFDRARKVLEEL